MIMDWWSVFEYKDGVLYWKVRVSNLSIGSMAGNINARGYCDIGYDNKRYLRHRIVWEMFNGEIPDGMVVRHLNDVKGDDRIENLAIGTYRDNCLDRIRNKLIRKDNTTGIAGVYWRKRINRFVVYVNDCEYVGCYTTMLDAAAARKSWEAKNL